MAKPLNLSLLSKAMAGDPKIARLEEGWDRRDSNPSVQMSVRMSASSYKKFRALCVVERRTNGDMLEELMNHYIATRSQE